MGHLWGFWILLRHVRLMHHVAMKIHWSWVRRAIVWPSRAGQGSICNIGFESHAVQMVDGKGHCLDNTGVILFLCQLIIS